MKRIAFIIPGFGFSGKEKEYQKIAGFFQKRNIEPVIIHIDWKRKTLLDYIKQAKQQIEAKSQKGDEIYLLGFSFGAIAALCLSSEIKLKQLVLCSISPYFKEDMPQIKQQWKNWCGKRRCEAFDNISFSKLAKKIDCKTTILHGDKEGIEVERRAKDANKK